MSEIKAIETEYAGCRFRSRLEARWAVFFDALGIKWHYEEEGYELPSGRYLPDFRLERAALGGRADVWVEVKGSFTHAAFVKICRAALELPMLDDSMHLHPKILVLGEIPTWGTLPTGAEPAAPNHQRLDAAGDFLVVQQVAFRQVRGEEGQWCTKAIDDAVALPARYFDALTEEQSAKVRGGLTEPTFAPHIQCGRTIEAAYRAARSARFEFGQSGATI